MFYINVRNELLIIERFFPQHIDCSGNVLTLYKNSLGIRSINCSMFRSTKHNRIGLLCFQFHVVATFSENCFIILAYLYIEEKKKWYDCQWENYAPQNSGYQQSINIGQSTTFSNEQKPYRTEVTGQKVSKNSF